MSEAKETFSSRTLGENSDARRVTQIIIYPSQDKCAVEYEYGSGDPFVACDPPIREKFMMDRADMNAAEQLNYDNAITSMHGKASTDNPPRAS